MQEAGIIDDANVDELNVVINQPIDFLDDTITQELDENNLPENGALIDIANCENVPWTEFLGERIGARVMNSCLTAYEDNGVTLIQSFIDNLPIMMFFCVPLLAFFMKLLYLFKGRKYVEHLMFLFHTHSFIFALAILTIALVRLSVPFPTIDNYIAPVTTAIWIYASVYVFLALKRVYQQGLFMTSVKLFFLFPCYAICMSLVFASGFVLTFITI